MALALYLITAGAIALCWSRGLQRISRGTALVLLLLPLVFTGRAMLTNRVYAPIDMPFAYEPHKSHAGQFGVERLHDIALSDLHCQIIPWQKAVRHALSLGEWPLWNPFILCGDILAAAAQPAVYDPLTWLALLLPLPHALTFGAAMTFFLAGFFTFAFARARGRSELAALFAAAAFMFGGMFAFYVGWPLARSWAFLPLLLFGVHRVVHERRGGVLLAAFVLTIVAGHPESVLHIVSVGAVFGIYELCKVRTNVARSTSVAIGAGIIALLLTAVYLLPFAEAASQSFEHDLRERLYAPTPYGKIISPERREHRIGRTFLPYYDGLPWRGATSPGWDPLSSRAGSLVLALALAAPLCGAGASPAPLRRRGWRRHIPPDTWFFFILGVVCTLAGFGAAPVAHLLHELPLFDIAINERLGFAAVLAMAMLAAITIDALDRRVAMVILAVAAALGAAAWLTRHAAFADAALTREVLLAELVPLAVAAVLIALRTRHAATALIALLLLQRAVVDGTIYPALPQRLFYPRTPLIDSIPKDARVAGLGHTFIPNSAAMFELEDPRGYEAMTNKRLTETYKSWSRMQTAWFNVIDDPSRPFLSFLNVGYFLADGTRLVKNERVLPRAFVPRRVRYERDGGPVLAAMERATDFADLAWIEADYEPFEAPNGPGRVSLRRDGLAFELDAQMDAGGWVVISETAWRGWRAYVDGVRVPMQFANHAFLGVHVPAGRHRLRLVYLPESFTRGRAVSLATLALVIIFAAWRRSSSISRPPSH